MIRRLLIFALLFLPQAAHAAPLVADLSTYHIYIDAGFRGTRVFLFGARNDPGDVVAVIRGPKKNFMMRKKEKVLGLWVNSERMKFYGMPDFYAVASSKPLSGIAQNGLFAQMGIGQEGLIGVPSGERAEFAQAFLQYQQGRGLYQQEGGELQFMGETLFKTVIEFPDNIPSGNYTAEFYLISDGEIVGMQSTPITVIKSGLDAFVYNYAHGWPALYGITAIVLALSAGWFAGRLFERI